MTRAWLVMTVLFAASTAFAQAPGEVVPAPPAAPAQAPPDGVMARRWAAGLALGGMGITGVEKQQTGLGLLELALRYRATRHLELELRVGAGDSKSGGTMMPADEIRFGEVDLRYRFAPGHVWDGWLEGGIGAFGDVPQEGNVVSAPNQPSQSGEHGLLGLGIGGERRFGAFAIDAVLRGYVFGGNQGKPPPPIMFDPPASAGELTLGASYYF